MIEYTVEVHYSTKKWYLDGDLHRVDGPAIEWANGEKWWYQDGKKHRVDGPAIEGVNGYKSWYLNGICHREDGPAVECANGTKYWYLNDKQLTEAEFNNRFAKVVTIDGVQYKLTRIE